MARLSEPADDASLEAGQIAEEKLKSIDYDVWRCERCGEELVVAHKAMFSSLQKCPSCRYRTVKTTTKTIEAATTRSGGRALATRHCTHCGFHEEKIRRTPRVSSSSGGSSFSGGGGGGGSSFGGGSAGGGGAGRGY